MKCKNCNKTIISKYAKIFCSSSCSAKYNNKKRKLSKKTKTKIANSVTEHYDKSGRKIPKKGNYFILKCKFCQKTFTSKNRYLKVCGKSCLHNLYVENAKTMWASGKGRTVSRSKNEKEFYKLVKEHYPDSIPNKRIRGWEADIIIPSLKLAIHWNGDWHYTVVITPALLKKVENRDRLKYSTLEKEGFQNYIIKDIVSEQKNYGHNTKVSEEFVKLQTFIQNSGL